MDKSKETKHFYTRLEVQLEQHTTWPAPYLFKFIVPTDQAKVATLFKIFEHLETQINSRESSKGTYTSVSVKTTMESPQAVIDKYLEVSNIEGVISL